MNNVDLNLDTTTLIGFFCIYTLLVALLTWFFYIDFGFETKCTQRFVTFIIAFFIFPIYLIILGVQQPVSDVDGKESYLLTFVSIFFFWPLYFLLRSRKKPYNRLEAPY